MSLENYKIHSLIQDYFEDYPLHAIDLFLHTKEDVVLQRKTHTNLHTGLKETRDYSYDFGSGPEIVAKVDYTYTMVAPYNIPVSWVAKRSFAFKRSFALMDGMFGNQYSIDGSSYDLTNGEEFRLSSEIMEAGRHSVIADIRSKSGAGVAYLNPSMTYDEVRAVGSTFFNLHSSEIASYIATGGKDFHDAVRDDTTTTWLDDVFAFPDVEAPMSFRAYMQWRLFPS